MADRYRAGSATESGVPFGRAARELGLRIGELDLAVQVGEVRTVASGPEGTAGATGSAGPRRIRGEDVERHRSAEGFPDTLRARLRTVGTKEGAELAGIAPTRFVRLARGGLLVPVRFWINRYGAVVWQYLASDVVEFAERRPDLLTGRLPADLRAASDDGADRRGTRWRALRVEQLEAQAEDPWQRAAAAAAVLAPAQLVPAVPDQAERALIGALRPALTSVRPSAPAGRAAVEGVVFADGPDEVGHYQARVAALTAVARGRRAPLGPEGVGPGGGAEGGVATAGGGGARPPTLSPSAPLSTEAADRDATGAVSGDRPPAAAEPGADERKRATVLSPSGGAASDPLPPPGGPGDLPAERDAPGAVAPAQPPAPGGLRAVRRALDRLLARGGQSGAVGRRERPAGWPRTVPGRLRRHPVDAGTRRRSPSGRISGRP
ncbi:DUF6397 family protein [Streptomyces mobaraensis]|uniref:DUF6397 family protein n=1 Tax=Streptomyces mobaraensis TaxID=35621 RepID=UPI003319BEB8